MSKQAMIDAFKRHVDAELAGDLDTTMATMSDAPHLTNVPTLMGGVGREGVRAFYAQPSGRQVLPSRRRPHGH